MASTGTSEQNFVKERSKKYYSKVKSYTVEKNTNLLSSAADWQISGDLPSLDAYPEIIKSSGQRPDIVVYSESLKSVIMVELTVPFETRIEFQHQYKMAKYEDLANQIRKSGYAAVIMAVEVGARGFVGTSVYNLLTRLGLKSKKRTKAMKNLAVIAEKSSSWLWSRRNESRLMK